MAEQPQQVSFHKSDEPKKPAAPPSGTHRKRKIIIQTGQNGATGNCQWPDPEAPMGGKWLILPRNKEIEVDERAIMRQKDKFVVDPETGDKQLIYPVNFLD